MTGPVLPPGPPPPADADAGAPVARLATAADLPGLTALRTRVFVEEQGVPPEVERDDRDATAVHVVSLGLPADGAPAGRVVATGRLLVDGRRASIGRMAADAAVRGRGHGAAVLAELHRQARLRGATEVELHAQVTARGFYERAGYAAVGAEYLEAGIRHVTMRRTLAPDGDDRHADRAAP
ncbi:GNAT family N-acetyltransferase [Geodermatophilus sp. YIM 151500]|uniref:GNAT family N-acetyltransferase n=1 Tax=Geodermatophilus sp. YIM 151500 TaxID=2984531 RepID=UPI0021E3BCF5|nr:GNAT family N-acetyltransferase [Geodermatophilus sp. YIM 151500]MCV2491719.1 GNAT family N-acetyltransferase [Geodermatophilus sp. YIM 151500]